MTPIATPTITANATLTTATRIDACTATRTLDNTSRPSSSVPNQCSPLGGRSAFGTSTSLMPKGAIHCAVTATTATAASTLALTTVTGLLVSSRQDESRARSPSGAVSVGGVVVMTAESLD